MPGVLVLFQGVPVGAIRLKGKDFSYEGDAFQLKSLVQQTQLPNEKPEDFLKRVPGVFKGTMSVLYFEENSPPSPKLLTGKELLDKKN